MKEKSITERIYSTYSLNDIRRRMVLLGYSKKDGALKFLNFRLLTKKFSGGFGLFLTF